MFSCFCVTSGWLSGFHFHVHCLLHVFIFHRLAPEEYLSEHFSPCTSIYITVPWKWKWKYFQLMYLFKGQMKFLSQIESPIVRYVQQNLLPQVLFSHKCCHTTFKNVFIVTIEKREKRWCFFSSLFWIYLVWMNQRWPSLAKTLL